MSENLKQFFGYQLNQETQLELQDLYRFQTLRRNNQAVMNPSYEPLYTGKNETVLLGHRDWVMTPTTTTSLEVTSADGTSFRMGYYHETTDTFYSIRAKKAASQTRRNNPMLFVSVRASSPNSMGEGKKVQTGDMHQLFTATLPMLLGSLNLARRWYKAA